MAGGRGEIDDSVELKSETVGREGPECPFPPLNCEGREGKGMPETIFFVRPVATERTRKKALFIGGGIAKEEDNLS